jgi:hypothetical protein
VNNVDPVITAINISPNVVQLVGGSATIQAGATFTDQGTLDTHIAQWSWGDGTANSPGTVTGDPGDGSVAATSHSYSATGVYVVTLTVTDDDTGSDTEVYRYVVVYDPSAGFVTGGGWIYSPAGAYVPDPSLEGKATFGFESKYLKGANVPTGNTEFQFHAAGMDFKSTSYEWLVVAGTKAMYKGVGKINGAGNYGFMLSAIDGGAKGADLFRIQIWDKDNGDTMVYDNMIGQDALANPATTITGSIVVHSK